MGIKFIQSRGDFPLTVELGGRSPVWGLSRWAECNAPSAGRLAFRPLDDEALAMRGNSRSLLYKGRRRSHRFTILNDGAFEYDVILKKETESNVIELVIEGSENFDFFRQPDYVSDPFLKGSYAVYLKNPFAGQGTGKLCHIHRPKIIDSRGRWCWGDLQITGNRLLIVVPEDWLGSAKYPVVVDPVIGTETVGSQTKIKWETTGAETTMTLTNGQPVNRFLLGAPIPGRTGVTGYYYAYASTYGTNEGGIPIIYGDANSKPRDWRLYDYPLVGLGVSGSKPAGWRPVSFTTDAALNEGDYIRFGLNTYYRWTPRFDYGGMFYYGYQDEELPDIYIFRSGEVCRDIKLSMYFTYTAPRAFVRTVTQFVCPLDVTSRTSGAIRNVVELINPAIGNNTSAGYQRAIITEGGNETAINTARGIVRKIAGALRPCDFTRSAGAVVCRIFERVAASGFTLRRVCLVIKIVSAAGVRDYLIRRFLHAKEELVIKSKICVELEIESKLQ
jgi:hypothetical protein